MYVGNIELTTCLYLCCLTLLWRTKRFSFIPIFIIEFENQDLMLLKTSCLPRQHRVWQNSTGWKFQFAHINPETKYQKAFAKMLRVEKTRQKHWRSLSVAALCAALNLASVYLLPERPQSPALTGMQEILQQCHCSAQRQEHIWPFRLFSCSEVTPKHSSRILYRNPDLFCGKKLLWNLLVTVQKCVPQPKQFQQTSESNSL